MKSFLVTILLACPVLFGGVAFASSNGSVPFHDGDVLLSGTNDGVQCTGLCIKTERRGNTLITSVYDEDAQLVKVSADSLGPDSASIRAAGEIDLNTPERSGTVLNGGTRILPAGGNGSISQNDVFPGNGGFWDRNTTFTFSNQVLVDVTVTVDFVHYMQK